MTLRRAQKNFRNRSPRGRSGEVVGTRLVPSGRVHHSIATRRPHRRCESGTQALAARRQETHHLADAAVCGLPLLQLIIDEFQPPELVIEQRPDFREPRRWPDPGVKPREVPRPSPRARQGVRRRGPAARRRRPHSWDDHAIGSVGGRRVCDSMARTLLTVMQ